MASGSVGGAVPMIPGAPTGGNTSYEAMLVQRNASNGNLGQNTGQQML